MLEWIRASRFLIGLLLVLLAWAEVASSQMDEDLRPADTPDLIRSTYATSSRGGARLPSALGRETELLVARSQMPPPTPTPALLSALSVLPALPVEPPPTPTLAPPKTQYLGLFKVTGYSDSPRNGTDGRGITRSGERTGWGVVAVDPSVIPLGSELTIEGMEGTLFRALDTGSGVIGHWVDVWFHTDEEALRHGVRERKVYLVVN